jgi:multicomponent Na+:H+ antiporter subunit C
MFLVSSLLAGILFGVSTYLILQGSFVRILFGFILIANAANLVFLAMIGDPRGRAAPVLAANEGLPMTDPLPQALILTAIVIGFAVSAYFLFLLYRIFLDWKTTDAVDLFNKSKPTDV